MSNLARAAFVLLVVASFAAFFVAQRLKSTPQVATIATLTAHFSPNGDGRSDTAHVRLRIRRDDDVTASVVDATGTEVRRLANAVPAREGRALRVAGDGTDAAGGRAPDGVYNVRVSLRRGGRAATLEPPLVLDTVAPNPTVKVGGTDGSRWITGPVARPVPYRVLVVSRARPTDVEVVRTDLAEPAVVARMRLAPGVRTGSWDGRANGEPAPPGTYQIVALVTDSAGNVGRSAPPATESGPVRGTPGVSVRRLLARPPADPVRAGAMARFDVDSRGRPYRWSVRRIGQARPVSSGRRRSGGRLRVRAPDGDSGLHVLELRAATDRTAVPFAVQGARPAPILVVLPTATWFGSDGLDDDRDGLPDTLERGGPVAYPKLLARGLPDGFADGTAALLAFLDDQGVRYDITTDLTLAASRSGLTGEREGVLLAGPLRWVSTELARRLRRYASAGGRVASFGTESLRRGVDIARDRLLRPLAPTDADPFGAKLRPLRTLGTPEPLLPIADEGASGLLTGVQALPGFSRVEESAPSGRVRVALAAVDLAALEQAESQGESPPETLPALTLSELDEGIVIRVGLPEWGVRLREGSVPVQQLTRNVADLLRGAEPEIRSFP